MNKIISILSILIFFSCSGFSQNTIKGRVLNEEKEPLSFATVALLNPADSILKYFGVTNEDGVFQIKSIKDGKYILQFSFVGMQTSSELIDIPLESDEDLGDKIMSTPVLEEVIVEAELIPVKFKNDTLEFDVKAFKTRPGAAAEELLRQLPGVEVDDAGNVKAEGEEVVRVLVDGKEFFDDDPKVATKNLPAKALSKVQLIDRKTEEAIFSGIDDGIREKTINLKLKEDNKRGYFGEFAVGVGSQATYKAEGRVYRFTEKTQHALMGMYNNINEFNFTNKDNNQFGSKNKGVNRALAGGINLSFNPNKQNRYFVSYLGNRRIKDLQEEVHSENFLSNGTFEQDEDINQTDTDQPHGINFGIRHNFNPQQRLILDGRMRIMTSDIFTQNVTTSSFEEELVNQLDNESTTNGDAFTFFTKATYIAKSVNEKTQFKTEFRGSYNDNNNRLDWSNRTEFFDPFREVLLQQFQMNDRDRLFVFAEPSILRKLNPTWSMSFGTRIGLDERGLNRREGTMNDIGAFEEVDIPDVGTRQNIIQPTFIINRMGNKSQLNIRLDAVVNQFDRLQNELSLGKENYLFLLPTINYQSQYKSGRRINLRYSASYLMPEVEQLIPVDNPVDQLNIIRGNLDLKPEQSHQISANWLVFDQFSFTSFSVRLAGNFTKDKIQWAQTVNDDFVRITSPVNVDNDINLNAYVDFSTPIRSLGIDLNFTASENWNRSIVFINEEENINTNLTHNLNIAFENRKNDVLFVRLNAAISLTDSRFSIAENQNNTFFNTSYTGSIRVTPNKKWNFGANANIVNFNAQSFDEAVSVPLISAEMSYFFMQAEKANLTLKAFDILNQFTGIQRIGNVNFLMERRWNTLTQYFMLSFNMRFR
ncbi:MAG: outer membrane beta-barrel protein [Bacteroidota bacterium]